MSRIEEIRSAAQAHYPSGTNHEEIKVASFIRGARYADETMIEKLRELKRGYEDDLDAEPRVYERNIQLCAKISLIERLILELEEE